MLPIVNDARLAAAATPLPPDDLKQVAVALVRTSTIMQVETGHSMITQPERIRAYAAQSGLVLKHVYEEPGISGRKAKRATVDSILRDARAGKFGLLIVTDVSRFFRNLEALISTIKVLRACGVDFISIDDGIDTRRKDSLGNELVIVVLGELAELYAHQLAHNTREGKYRRFKLGLWNGPLPFGYCDGVCTSCHHPNGPGYCPRHGLPDASDGETPILHPIDSEAVRLTFETYASGDHSDQDVAEFLRSYIFTLPDGTTRRFRVPCKRMPVGEETSTERSESQPYGFRPPYKDFVRFVLQRPFYAGLVTYAHRPPPGAASATVVIEENEGVHPAIVPLPMFDHVQQVRRSIGTNARHQAMAIRIFPLSGVLRCGRCGGPMRGTAANQGVRYYQCSQRAEKHRLPGGGHCNQPLVRAEELEAKVEEVMRRLAVPPAMRADVLTHCYYEDDAEVIDFRRRKLIGSLQRYIRLYEVGAIAWEEFQQRVAALRETISGLTPSSQATSEEAEGLLVNLAPLWQAAQPLERKMLASVVFQYLLVDGENLREYALRSYMTGSEA